ncbi:MAG TPA: DUF5666 domain-containing protein, partial [Gammaproteobacteria bacterium]|nr:DUF5666 domain-containing protein [Gammaproteobacteria bacterium]
FGSIFINGAEFDTDSSQFFVDGEVRANQTAANLKVGMIVSLEVETEDGSYNGNALKVVYDDEVQGPVSGLALLSTGETQRTFNVFGQTITIDDTSTLFNGASLNPQFGFDTISNDDVLEISGFRTSANAITATYVEWKETLVNDSEVELRGTVKDYLPPAKEFMLDGFQITFEDSTVIDVSGGLVNDVYVEIKGAYQTASSSVHASKIEQEDEGFGDDLDDVSLQGIISNFNGTDDFEIDGLPIDASVATKLSPANALSLLGEGVEIEVEGNIVGGKLIADEVELREGDTKLRTTVSAIALPNRFQVEYPGQPLGSGLGTIWVNIDGQTLFEDEDDSGGKTPVENFSIGQLGEGDFVKIEGFTDSGEVSAQIVKRLEPGKSSKLQGAVEAFVRDAPASITILGVGYPIDAFASYEDAAGVGLTKIQFFNLLEADPNAVVELEDDDPADADADNVKFDD